MLATERSGSDSGRRGHVSQVSRWEGRIVSQTVPGTSVQEEEGLRCAGWKSSCREAAGKGWWAREGPAEEGAVHRAAALEGP